VCVELGELNFVLLEYSVEYLTRDSSTRLIPKVAIHCRVIQKPMNTWYVVQVGTTTVVQNESI